MFRQGNRRSHFTRHPLPGLYGMISFAANALQCIFNGDENPRKLPLSLGISSPCRRRPKHGHIGSMHRKIMVKIAHVVPEICSRTDRQTDRRTQTCSSQCVFFAAAPGGEVNTEDIVLWGLDANNSHRVGLHRPTRRNRGSEMHFDL